MWKCVNRKPKNGFTLIELSIVLVIIGLVIGGVLVGRDLIAAAQMRLVIKQIEQFNLATTTFREKYKALPGDIKNPADYGLSGTAGNGDGCISVCYDSFVSSGSYLMTTLEDLNNADNGFEIANFWRHLGQAKMIPGEYDGRTMMDEQTIGSTLPKVATRPQIGWVAYTTNEISGAPSPVMQNGGAANVILIGGIGNYISMMYVDPDWGYALRPPLEGNRGFTPAQLKYMDDKTDDGRPGNGKVRAYYNYVNIYGGYDWYLDTTYNDNVHLIDPAPSTPQRDGQWCAYVPSGTTWVYNVVDNSASCGLRIKAGF